MRERLGFDKVRASGMYDVGLLQFGSPGQTSSAVYNVRFHEQNRVCLEVVVVRMLALPLLALKTHVCIPYRTTHAEKF